MKLEPTPGTYALILKSDSNAWIKIGRWRDIQLKTGYYMYIGSAFGPGGIRARVSRHLRMHKRMHWHIDYLLVRLSIVEVWISYDSNRLEHQWANMVLRKPEMMPVQGFGCSDCRCQSHLFFMENKPREGEFNHVVTFSLVIPP